MTEKEKFLVLYGLCIFVAIVIFLYLTRIKGLPTDDYLFVSIATLLPSVVIAVTGSVLILRFSSKCML